MCFFVIFVRLLLCYFYIFRAAYPVVACRALRTALVGHVYNTFAPSTIDRPAANKKRFPAVSSWMLKFFYCLLQASLVLVFFQQIAQN